jgi:hypothetical protein
VSAAESTFGHQVKGTSTAHNTRTSGQVGRS